MKGYTIWQHFVIIFKHGKIINMIYNQYDIIIIISNYKYINDNKRKEKKMLCECVFYLINVAAVFDL